MGRMNLAGNWEGESSRLTVRVSRPERSALVDLCEMWGLEPSAAIRRAILATAASVDRERREELLAQTTDMALGDLRRLATRLAIADRSRMAKAALLRAIHAELQRPRHYH